MIRSYYSKIQEIHLKTLWKGGSQSYLTHGNHLGECPKKLNTCSLLQRDCDLIGPAKCFIYFLDLGFQKKKKSGNINVYVLHVVRVRTVLWNLVFRYIFYVYVCIGCGVKSICYPWAWCKKFESCIKLPKICIDLKGELHWLPLEFVT